MTFHADCHLCGDDVCEVCFRLNGYRDDDLGVGKVLDCEMQDGADTGLVGRRIAVAVEEPRQKFQISIPILMEARGRIC